MRDQTVLGALAITALAAIEVVCLLTGNDGATLLPFAGIIGGIGGYGIARQRNQDVQD